MSADLTADSLGGEGRLERLYEAALGLSEAEREAFLDRACADDPRLRAELASLLVDVGAADAFMEDLGRFVEPAGDAPPQRLVDALADRYRIEERIGVGGMSTVYRAHDLRHERTVAVKVLKPALAAIVGGDRFLAEIKTTAKLQHPNILPLFDSGEVDGLLFYVMPHVDGESLRARLLREPQLPIDEAVRIATSVAEALDYAHRQGVIHRDIKPANLLLLDGKPVISDFGIALAAGAGGGGRLTETGMSLGTPHYMSPEQATGSLTLGPATDIYGLGCVLYEMLIGEPPYPGATAQAVLGRIISSEPVSASAARGTVPMHVDAAIRRAIERVPSDRFGRAVEFAQALADPGFRHRSRLGAGSPPVGSGRTYAIRMGLVAMLAMGLLLPTTLGRTRSAPVIPYELTFEAGEGPSPLGNNGSYGPSFALSDDGSTMAYVGTSAEYGHQIWLRQRDGMSMTGVPLAGTGGAVQPFFSPDGRHVGFIHHDSFQLRVVSLDGGPPTTLVDRGVQRLGAAWGPDGYVYYVGEDFGLYRVPGHGEGASEQVASAKPGEGIRSYAWPDVLPGGKGVLVTMSRLGTVYDADDQVGVIDVGSGRSDELVHAVLGRYLPTGHLVYVNHEGGLVAAPFDEEELRVVGPAVPLAAGLPRLRHGPDVALSPSGRLLYDTTPWPRREELVWVDRSGEAVPVEPGWSFVSPTANQQPVLSPGDRRIAVGLVPVRGPLEVWIKQIGGGGSRVPFDTHGYRPTWSPDGEAILFVYDGSVWTGPADGAVEPEVLFETETLVAQAQWAPDGTWVLFRTSALTARGDIFGFSPTDDATPRPLVATEFVESSPALSPDGKFLAYVSDASGDGRPEVLVRPYPGLEDQVVQISIEGGVEPVWAHSGEELFYRKFMTNELISVRVDTSEQFRVLDREALFTLPPGIVQADPWLPQYDVTEDGKHFLMLRYLDGESQPGEGRYRVVENFDQELLRRMGN